MPAIVAAPPRTAPAFRILHAFTYAKKSEGSSPAGRLLVGPGGVLYGTTQGGGVGKNAFGGTVYSLTPQGGGYRESVLHYFTGDQHPSLDGAHPASGVVADRAGNLFGTTTYGGTDSGSGYGTVFELRRSGARYVERVLHRFAVADPSSDGTFPTAAPIVASDGSLYGTTTAGGGGACNISGPGCGTVYRLERTATGYAERILYRFRGGSDGAYPAPSLVADHSGTLFGTTAYGGSVCPNSGQGCGTVFKLTALGAGYRESVLYRFRGGAGDGANPAGTVLPGAGGALYGTTEFGGAGSCATALFNAPSCGTLYALVPSGATYSESVLHNFLGGADGFRPQSTLVAGNNGYLYGATFEGGTGTCFVYAGYNFGCGTVFRASPIGGVDVIYNFGRGSSGDAPSDVVVSPAGTLFGTTPENWTGNGVGTAYALTL